MQRTAKHFALSTTLALLLAMMATPILSASLGTKVLRGAAIGFAITKVAKPLDSFINAVTFRHGVKTSLATKVVPVLSVGEKGYIGGAQVSGPKSLVDRVQVVLQYEKNFSNNNYRAKILLPSSSINPLKLGRVPKVGITATIDVALDGRQKYSTVGTGIGAGDVLRGAAVLVAIKNFGSTINSGLNTITFNKGAATKVVPLGTVGEKTYLGGAQISASASAIRSVNAVWQYEDLFSGGVYRVKILVPTTSSNPLKMKRVEGAGVTAIIDMALSQQKDLQSENRYRRAPIFRSPVKYQPKDVYQVLEGNPRHDNGKHKGWYKGKQSGSKNLRVDEKRRKIEDRDD